MMKITGLSHLFKWENLHNWWLTKYFFAPLYLCAEYCIGVGEDRHSIFCIRTLVLNQLYLCFNYDKAACFQTFVFTGIWGIDIYN